MGLEAMRTSNRGMSLFLLYEQKAILWTTSTMVCSIAPSVCSCSILRTDFFSSNALARRSPSPICGPIPAVLTPLILLPNLLKRLNWVSSMDYKGELLICVANVIDWLKKGARTAAQRKLEHELGIKPNQVPLDNFEFLTRIHYLAPSDGMWGEHESKYPSVMVCSSFPSRSQIG